MGKYVVRNKTTNVVFGEFDFLDEANEKLIEHILDNNEDAMEFLEHDEELSMDIIYPPKRTREALLALVKLFTISEAWNKKYGFVPDFSNKDQRKYSPYFTYSETSAGFVCIGSTVLSHSNCADISSHICFGEENQAIKFGRQFQGLYNDIFIQVQ